MKRTTLNLAMIAMSLLAFTACEKSNTNLDTPIEGTYIGTITTESGLKSTTDATIGVYDATAEVTNKGNGQVEVHFYGTEMDSTIMLNYYENNDSINVCVNGDAFEAMYGRMMQNDMMSQGGMMGGMNSGTSAWTNHMSVNHTAGDEHFGGFDMTNDTFSYTIKRESGDVHFQGKRI